MCKLQRINSTVCCCVYANNDIIRPLIVFNICWCCFPFKSNVRSARFAVFFASSVACVFAILYEPHKFNNSSCFSSSSGGGSDGGSTKQTPSPNRNTNKNSNNNNNNKKKATKSIPLYYPHWNSIYYMKSVRSTALGSYTQSKSTNLVIQKD